MFGNFAGTMPPLMLWDLGYVSTVDSGELAVGRIRHGPGDQSITSMSNDSG